MHHTARVRFRERVTDLLQQERDPLGGQRSKVLHDFLEIAALEQLHHVIEAAVICGAEIKETDGVLRSQERGRLRLALEAAQL